MRRAVPPPRRRRRRCYSSRQRKDLTRDWGTARRRALESPYEPRWIARRQHASAHAARASAQFAMRHAMQAGETNPSRSHSP
jgi:hypothetical protein